MVQKPSFPDISSVTQQQVEPELALKRVVSHDAFNRQDSRENVEGID